MKQFEEWEGFKGRIWKEEINTRDFIQENYKPYDGDESFLAEATEATTAGATAEATEATTAEAKEAAEGKYHQ